MEWQPIVWHHEYIYFNITNPLTSHLWKAKTWGKKPTESQGEHVKVFPDIFTDEFRLKVGILELWRGNPPTYVTPHHLYVLLFICEYVNVKDFYISIYASLRHVKTKQKGG